MAPLLLVTCDEPPISPLNGNNRKIYEVMRALAGEFEIAALCYPRSEVEAEQIRQHWRPHGVKWHFLPRLMRWRRVRAIASKQSIPTATRDFAAEHRWVLDTSRGRGDARLLIDFISGAPLLGRVSGAGVILSGHDCMSYLFAQEAKNAPTWQVRLRFLIRRQFALHAEKRYAHLAERVHLVSAQDVRELGKINPAISPIVVPIGGGEIAAPLLEWNTRTENIIWGNIGSELISTGLRQLLHAAKSLGVNLAGWKVVGKVPKAEALRLVPELDNAKCLYVPRVEQMSALLGKTRCLMLPDIGGTGQKNRALDGLAHGCCVLGLSEVFRGVGTEADRAYLTGPDFAGVFHGYVRSPAHDLKEYAANGQALYNREFSSEALRTRWRELIQACHCLPVHAH